MNLPPNCELSWPDETDGLRVASVARLDPAAKGQDLILGVFSEPRWRTRNIAVTFYGTGPSQRSLSRYARMLDLGENVQFGGHALDVSQVWKQNHALILASRYEGTPLAVCEAMSCGRPVIATNVGGNSEVIIDNETGFLAESPSVKHLSEAMERAWNQRDRWPEIGEAAKTQIRKMRVNDPVQHFAQLLLSQFE